MWLLSKLPVFQAVNTWCPNFRTLTSKLKIWTLLYLMDCLKKH